ncbi:hypothetical protein R75461_07253 [Paraburkholderia nemoris]|uniref:hypothetical protein n=1 Tax=Paraburkholderia nemoris TaxID=2793076 RepID=UPI00190A7EBD|nr:MULTISPECIES: hypothetical protein [Paraburkholderia]MBK3786092.1 hypothetical protein [Paraburkholderia aspalathi]CAE6846192.1 hypothetical protein R75461_07253 [Paraburkholderia nemoris]
MTTKQEAKSKLNAAAKGCEAAEKAWLDAYNTLSGSVSTNGYGIHHNPYELRDKLLKAQARIQESLRALDGIDWPTNADYDIAE